MITVEHLNGGNLEFNGGDRLNTKTEANEEQWNNYGVLRI